MVEDVAVVDVVPDPEVGRNGAKGKSLRERIIASMDRTSELVYVPQWGEEIEVRSMSGSERADSMRKYLDAETGSIDYNALYPELIIATCYIPGEDERVFGPGDVGVIATKNAGALELLANAALRLSGLDAEARDRAGKSS